MKQHNCHQGLIIVLALAIVVCIFAYGVVFVGQMQGERLTIAKDLALVIIGAFAGYLTGRNTQQHNQGETVNVGTKEEEPPK